MIEEMLKILEFIFGGGFKPIETTAKRHYIEYVPGKEKNFIQQLELEPFTVTH